MPVIFRFTHQISPGIRNTGKPRRRFTCAGWEQIIFLQSIPVRVAVYQDNIYHGPNVVQAFAAYDLDRVEVLKGPQGTLYGRNSTAGLVNFISRKPEIGGELNGYLRAEVGEYETTNFQGAVGIPISDTVAGRASFAFNRNTGLWDNSNPDSGQDNAGRFEDVSGRVQLLIQPNESFVHTSQRALYICRPGYRTFQKRWRRMPTGRHAGPDLRRFQLPGFHGFYRYGRFSRDIHDKGQGGTGCNRRDYRYNVQLRRINTHIFNGFRFCRTYPV